MPPVDAETLIWFAVPAKLVTPVLSIVIEPEPLVTEIAVPAVRVALVSEFDALPMRSWPEV